MWYDRHSYIKGREKRKGTSVFVHSMLEVEDDDVVEMPPRQIRTVRMNSGKAMAKVAKTAPTNQPPIQPQTRRTPTGTLTCIVTRAAKVRPVAASDRDNDWGLDLTLSDSEVEAPAPPSRKPLPGVDNFVATNTPGESDMELSWEEADAILEGKQSKKRVSATKALSSDSSVGKVCLSHDSGSVKTETKTVAIKAEKGLSSSLLLILMF